MKAVSSSKDDFEMIVQREATAYHEAGHAIIAMSYGFAVLIASIEPEVVSREVVIPENPFDEIALILRALVKLPGLNQVLRSRMNQLLGALDEIREATAKHEPPRAAILQDLPLVIDRLVMELRIDRSLRADLARALRKALKGGKKTLAHKRLGHVQFEIGLPKASGDFSPTERDLLAKKAVVGLSGFYAELLFPDSEIEDAQSGARGDFFEVNLALRKLVETDAEIHEFEALLNKRTDLRVKRFEGEIEATKSLLLSETTVSGERICKHLKSLGLSI